MLSHQNPLLHPDTTGRDRNAGAYFAHLGGVDFLLLLDEVVASRGMMKGVALGGRIHVGGWESKAMECIVFPGIFLFMLIVIINSNVSPVRGGNCAKFLCIFFSGKSLAVHNTHLWAWRGTIYFAEEGNKSQVEALIVTANTYEMVIMCQVPVLRVLQGSHHWITIEASWSSCHKRLQSESRANSIKDRAFGTAALRKHRDECGFQDHPSISVWALPRDCGEGCWEDEMQRLPITSGSCELERCYSHWDLFSVESNSSNLKIHPAQPQKQIHQ